MSRHVLERRFAAIGARVKLADGPWTGEPWIDVRADSRGEYFELGFTDGRRAVEVEVVDVRPRDRHLLLLTRVGGQKSKFLCGHDERHWFVAAVPETARGVSSVVSAKEALQPQEVRERVHRTRPKDRFRRRNTAYVRQGEWFFVPAAHVDPPDALVFRNEPLTRGGGTAHVIEFAYRRGGDVVYVNRRNRTGISEARYARLTPDERRRGDWTRRVRDPELYAKGAVRHPDHATIRLSGWHRVLMNTEHRALAMQHVVFID